MAEQYWKEIPNHFPFVKLGAFVVMPNHIHGIVIIDKKEHRQNNAGMVETKIDGFAGNKNPMLNDNLSRIIRWYKGRCSFEIRKIQPGFNWQSRFHEHIIRNDAEYNRIQNYIEANIENWGKDKFLNKQKL